MSCRAHTHEPGVFRHPHFGHIALDIQRIAQGQRRLPDRDQAPADKHNEDDTSHCNRQPDQREVEHVKRNAGLFRAEVGNDHVGRRANEGHHSAQQRRERPGA